MLAFKFIQKRILQCKHLNVKHFYRLIYNIVDTVLKFMYKNIQYMSAQIHCNLFVFYSPKNKKSCYLRVTFLCFSHGERREARELVCLVIRWTDIDERGNVYRCDIIFCTEPKPIRRKRIQTERTNTKHTDTIHIYDTKLLLRLPPLPLLPYSTQTRKASVLWLVWLNHIEREREREALWTENHPRFRIDEISTKTVRCDAFVCVWAGWPDLLALVLCCARVLSVSQSTPTLQQNVWHARVVCVCMYVVSPYHDNDDDDDNAQPTDAAL